MNTAPFPLSVLVAFCAALWLALPPPLVPDLVVDVGVQHYFDAVGGTMANDMTGFAASTD